MSAFGYRGPEEPAYGYVTVTADRDRLHLEGRYGYEDRETVSLWAGVNFELGTTLALTATPMLGGVFGRTKGIAAGYELSLAYGRFELTTEGEYLHDLDDGDESYFYSWSELTYAPSERWRVGIVVQRSKVYDTDLEIQRGALLGVSLGSVDITAYVLNLDTVEPIIALSLGVGF